MGIQINGNTNNINAGIGSLSIEDIRELDITGIATAANFKTGTSNVHSTGYECTNVNATGVITATSFVGNGANITGLNASEISSGTVPIARIGTGTKNTTTFFRGDGTFQVVNTDLVSDTSPQLGGNLDTNSKNIVFGDSSGSTVNRLTFGGQADLKLWHDGTNSVISNATGDLYINNNADTIIKPANDCFIKPQDGENGISVIGNGAVELYHDNIKTAYTHGSGFNIKGGNTSDQSELQIFGNQGQDASILLTSDDGDDNADNWRMYSQASDHSFALKSYASGGYQSVLKGTSSRTIELHYQGSKKLETVTGGVKVTGAYALAASSGNNPTIDNADGGQGRSLYFKTGGSARLIIQDDGHTRPASNNTFDLGTSNDRWRNVYTNDLNLSNKGSTNSVDNTWGDYTIQEGESDLFLINNRNGKKYKFNLTEVS